ncbi:MAG: bifunctional hydroxymethylpyrimidine kinase/phosphomethylpyrimidine kinase [Omnitrophica bacterium GWA2_52_8]|nr:MAG: bifunctional hydroxymethylpyrimidine kinase/phosphomethylpyrimidine kinase [Omnitrophica bacterium GWA2_52_8]
MKPIALTIAGSDPSGGAGIQADLKTFHHHGVYGMSVITLLTIQNTLGVKEVITLDAANVAAQLDAILEDIPPHAVKTGALGNARIVEKLAMRLCAARFPLVVDPVMDSSAGPPLMDENARIIFKEKIVPLAALLTPNLKEAQILSGIKVEDVASMKEAARIILALGPKAVLIKGGHLEGDATDVLYDGASFHLFPSKHIESRHTHGTGCAFSAAITAELAKGADLLKAVRTAKEFITAAILGSPGIGRGTGPVNHHGGKK